MPEPYMLGYAPGFILASGSPTVLHHLLDLPDAAPLTRGAVSIKGSRLAFMAAEAIASPTEVTPEYRSARDLCMRPKVHLRVSGLDMLSHQWDFLAVGAKQHGILNASEQGTGKTRAAWALWDHWRCQRTVIVAPKSLVPQWVQEYHLLFPACEPDVHLYRLDTQSVTERRAVIHSVTRHPSGGRQVLLLNYEVLVRLLPELLKFKPDCVIFDESWRIKSPRAGVTRAAHKLIDKTGAKVMLLTGTPIGNHAGDLWAQLRCFGKEAMPDTYAQFLVQHTNMYPVEIGGRKLMKPKGVANVAGLMRKVEPHWFRVTKEGCLSLPPKQHHLVRLPLPGPTQALYKQVKAFGAAALGAPGALDSEATIMLRLQQIAGGHRPFATDVRGMAWSTEPLWCPKIDWLETFARDRLLGDPSARLLVWCRFRAEVERAAVALALVLGMAHVGIAYGGSDPQLLEEVKASFNSRDPDGVQVLVCQIQKMAFGHNLQAADYSVHFSHSWSYVETVQAEDRAHRQGREGTVQYFQLAAEKTIDEDILKAIARKEDLAVRLSPST